MTNEPTPNDQSETGFQSGKEMANLAETEKSDINLNIFQEIEDSSDHVMLDGHRVRAWNIQINGYPRSHPELNLPQRFPVYFEVPGVQRHYVVEGWEDRIIIESQIVTPPATSDDVEQYDIEDKFEFNTMQELRYYLEEEMLPDVEALPEKRETETQEMNIERLNSHPKQLDDAERERIRKAVLRRRAEKQGR